MVLFVLLWLHNLGQARVDRARISLVLSFLIKYVSATLLFLDLLHWYYFRKQRLLEYVPRIIILALLSIALFAPFYRSLELFINTLSMNDWHFFTTSEALIGLTALWGIQLDPAAFVVRGVFLLITAYFIASYVRRPGTEEFHKVALATMCAVLFGVVGHVWPWYMTWVIGLAALIPSSVLSLWIVGLGLAFPFAFLLWVEFPPEVAALALYVFGLIWLIFVPRHWFSDRTPMGVFLRALEQLRAFLLTTVARIKA